MNESTPPISSESTIAASIDDLFVPVKPEAHEVPRPPIKRACGRCDVRSGAIDDNLVIVSPRGIAHFGEDYGDTSCGIDATGDGWWWPL